MEYWLLLLFATKVSPKVINQSEYLANESLQWSSFLVGYSVDAVKFL